MVGGVLRIARAPGSDEHRWHRFGGAARAQSLQEAHDIGETLQQKVETLDEVERAFVHLDFETSHNPASEHKQWRSTTSN